MARSGLSGPRALCWAGVQDVGHVQQVPWTSGHPGALLSRDSGMAAGDCAALIWWPQQVRIRCQHWLDGQVTLPRGAGPEVAGTGRGVCSCDGEEDLGTEPAHHTGNHSPSGPRFPTKSFPRAVWEHRLWVPPGAAGVQARVCILNQGSDDLGARASESQSPLSPRTPTPCRSSHSCSGPSGGRAAATPPLPTCPLCWVRTLRPREMELLMPSPTTTWPTTGIRTQDRVPPSLDQGMRPDAGWAWEVMNEGPGVAMREVAAGEVLPPGEWEGASWKGGV